MRVRISALMTAGSQRNPIRRDDETGGVIRARMASKTTWCVVLLLQRIQFLYELTLRFRQPTQSNKRPHDLEVDRDCARTAEH
jgi:hypothetical protein